MFTGVSGLVAPGDFPSVFHEVQKLSTTQFTLRAGSLTISDLMTLNFGPSLHDILEHSERFLQSRLHLQSFSPDEVH